MNLFRARKPFFVSLSSPKGGEGWGEEAIFFSNSPLSDSLPTRSSGAREEKRPQRVSGRTQLVTDPRSKAGSWDGTFRIIASSHGKLHDLFLGRPTRIRDFFGFNRAKHAVVEAAILATRIQILKPEEIRKELTRLESPLNKTAGEQERRAFDFLRSYIEEALLQLKNKKAES